MDDPRQAPPIVRLVTAAPVNGSDRKFTGTVGARVQSNLGFRTAGKIIERLVGVGEQVKAGQSLMARRNRPTPGARQSVTPLQQRVQPSFRRTRMSSDTPAWSARDGRPDSAMNRRKPRRIQQGATRRRCRSAGRRERGHLLDPCGRGWNGGRNTRRAGASCLRWPNRRPACPVRPREAVVALPETVGPAIGSAAEARIYGSDGVRYTAYLRQLSDAADPQTRTYEGPLCARR